MVSSRPRHGFGPDNLSIRNGKFVGGWLRALHRRTTSQRAKLKNGRRRRVSVGAEERRGGSEVWGGLERHRRIAAAWCEAGPSKWTMLRSDQLIEDILAKVQSRRRRRRIIRIAITLGGVAITVLVGLGLIGFGINGPFAHLWSRVQTGWHRPA
jgi:hypothetical protein